MEKLSLGFRQVLYLEREKRLQMKMALYSHFCADFKSPQFQILSPFSKVCVCFKLNLSMLPCFIYMVNTFAVAGLSKGIWNGKDHKKKQNQNCLQKPFLCQYSLKTFTHHCRFIDINCLALPSLKRRLSEIPVHSCKLASLPEMVGCHKRGTTVKVGLLSKH